jgi:hypothetical protein
MHHMAMLRLASINALAHALECHKDHLVDTRDELSDSARGALNGTDFEKFDQVSQEITSLTMQINLIERVEKEIQKTKNIGKNAEGKYQLMLYTEWAPSLYLVMENYVEMQYDMLRGELHPIAHGHLTTNPANVALNLIKGEDNQLERTVEGAFLEGYFKALR